MAGEPFRFASLLPLRAVEVTLRFIRPSRFPFFHQPALTGWIRTLLGESGGYHNYLTIDAPECGRERYERGTGYRFAVYCLAGGEAMLTQLIERLKGLPSGWGQNGRPMPLHDNVELMALRDLFSGRAIQDASDATEWDIHQLDSEAGLWAWCPAPRIRFWSPIWLTLKKGDLTVAKVRHRPLPKDPDKKDVAQDRGDVSLDRLRYIAEETFIRLVKERDSIELEHSASPGIEKRDAAFVWEDCWYRNPDGTMKRPGGLVGYLDLPGPGVIAPEDWRLWVLGQYVAIGGWRAFGLGRYRLETSDGEYTAAIANSFQ